MIYAIGTSQYHILSNHVAYACNVEVLHDENCKWWIHGWPYLDRYLLYNMPFAYCMGPTFACIGMWTGDFCFFIFQSFHYAHFQLWSADFFQIFQKNKPQSTVSKFPFFVPYSVDTLELCSCLTPNRHRPLRSADRCFHWDWQRSCA